MQYLCFSILSGLVGYLMGQAPCRTAVLAIAVLCKGDVTGLASQSASPLECWVTSRDRHGGRGDGVEVLVLRHPEPRRKHPIISSAMGMLARPVSLTNIETLFGQFLTNLCVRQSL